jgi:chloramphenicol 3-O phosphotransferase
MLQVIVLNGGSSSGKSSIAQALQDILPGQWLTFGVHALVEALPGRGTDPRSGLVLEPDGTVIVTAEFRAIEDIWYQGLVTMARLGARLILDEILLSGAAGQQRLQARLAGLEVRWAGVRCNPLVAAEREAARLIGTGQPTMRTATVVTTAAATVAKAGWASATPVRRTSP